MNIIDIFVYIFFVNPFEFPKNSVLNFIHELNENNKLSFLNVPIDTNNNSNFTNSTYKKTSNKNSCTMNFKSGYPFRYIKKSNY